MGVDEALQGGHRIRGGPSTGTGRPPTFEAWLWVVEEEAPRETVTEPPKRGRESRRLWVRFRMQKAAERSE